MNAKQIWSKEIGNVKLAKSHLYSIFTIPNITKCQSQMFYFDGYLPRRCEKLTNMNVSQGI